MHRPGDAEGARRVHRPDQPAVEPLGRDPEDDDLVEARVIAERFLGPDHGPALAREAARLPLLLARHPMRREESHAAIDAQRPLAAVLDRELRILREAEDVAVCVDVHCVLPGEQLRVVHGRGLHRRRVPALVEVDHVGLHQPPELCPPLHVFGGAGRRGRAPPRRIVPSRRPRRRPLRGLPPSGPARAP